MALMPRAVAVTITVRLLKRFMTFLLSSHFSIQRTLLIVDTIQLRRTAPAAPTLAPHFPHIKLPVTSLTLGSSSWRLFASLLQDLVLDLSSPSKCLQTAFLNEAPFEQRAVRLGIAQRGGRCVDPARAQGEVILVRDARAEDEFTLAPRLELD